MPTTTMQKSWDPRLRTGSNFCYHHWTIHNNPPQLEDCSCHPYHHSQPDGTSDGPALQCHSAHDWRSRAQPRSLQWRHHCCSKCWITKWWNQKLHQDVWSKQDNDRDQEGPQQGSSNNDISRSPRPEGLCQTSCYQQPRLPHWESIARPLPCVLWHIRDLQRWNVTTELFYLWTSCPHSVSPWSAHLDQMTSLRESTHTVYQESYIYVWSVKNRQSLLKKMARKGKISRNLIEHNLSQLGPHPKNRSF